MTYNSHQKNNDISFTTSYLTLAQNRTDVKNANRTHEILSEISTNCVYVSNSHRRKIAQEEMNILPAMYSYQILLKKDQEEVDCYFSFQTSQPKLKR